MHQKEADRESASFLPFKVLTDVTGQCMAVISADTCTFVIGRELTRSPRNHRVSSALFPGRSQTFLFTVPHYGQDKPGEELP